MGMAVRYDQRHPLAKTFGVFVRTWEAVSGCGVVTGSKELSLISQGDSVDVRFCQSDPAIGASVAARNGIYDPAFQRKSCCPV